MLYSEINVCDDTDGTKAREIEICVDTDAEIPRDIVVCAGQCDNPPELFLTGTDSPDVGSIYTASGGIKPYSWSISAGEISGGTITSLSGACGAGTVTVSDKCGQQESIPVRFPSGQWCRKDIHDRQNGCSDNTGDCSQALGNYYDGDTKYDVDSSMGWDTSKPSPSLTWSGILSNGSCQDGMSYVWNSDRSGIGITVPGFPHCVNQYGATVKPCKVTIYKWVCL